VSDGPVQFTLSADEALVLFEWVSRFTETPSGEFEDQAEEKVLWIIEGILEKALVAPFRADYGELLAAARDAVRSVDESPPEDLGP